MDDIFGAESVGKFIGNKVGCESTFDKTRMNHQGIEEADVVINAADIVGIQGFHHVFDGFIAGIAVGNQLGNHRVVKHGDFATFENAGINPHVF